MPSLCKLIRQTYFIKCRIHWFDKKYWLIVKSSVLFWATREYFVKLSVRLCSIEYTGTEELLGIQQDGLQSSDNENERMSWGPPCTRMVEFYSLQSCENSSILLWWPGWWGRQWLRSSHRAPSRSRQNTCGNHHGPRGGFHWENLDFVPDCWTD